MAFEDVKGLQDPVVANYVRKPHTCPGCKCRGSPHIVPMSFGRDF
jgi:hypothetical protein